MPLPQAPVVTVTPPEVRPLPDRELLWASVKPWGADSGSDSKRFPTVEDIRRRRLSDTPEPLHAFVNAAITATQRIFVLDGYLFQGNDKQSAQACFDEILKWMPIGLAANDVRLLTTAKGSQADRDEIQRKFAKRAEEINQDTQRRVGRVTIKVRFTLSKTFDFVHDRFAIIDNELWHFGATVGGLHNMVSAASRGWDATAHDAIRFFDDAWKGDGDGETKKRGRNRD